MDAAVGRVDPSVRTSSTESDDGEDATSIEENHRQRRQPPVDDLKTARTAADATRVKQAPRSGIFAPAVLAVSAVTALLSGLAVGQALAGPTAPRSDFAAFWRAARWVTHGRAGSLYPMSSFGGIRPTPHDGVFKGFLNPPHTAVLFAPFSATGLRSASVLFAALNLIVLSGLCVFAWRLLARRGFSTVQRITALLLMVGCPAIAISIVNGTMSLLILAAMLAVIAFDRDGDAWRTGLPLAVVAWKPQYAVLPVVYLLARRHLRAVAGAAMLTAASIAVSLPLTGVGAWREYLPFVNRYASTLDIWDLREARQLWLPRQMLNVRGLLVRALGSGSVSLVNMISVLIIGVAFVLVVVSARNLIDDRTTFAGWSAVVALTVVTSQHTNVSDGVLLLVPAVLLAFTTLSSDERGAAHPATALWWIAALDVAMLLGNPSGHSPVVPWSALVALGLTVVVTQQALGARALNRGRRAVDAETMTVPAQPDTPRPDTPRPDKPRPDTTRPDKPRRPTPPATRPSLEAGPAGAAGAADYAVLEPFLLATLAIAMTVMPYVIVGGGRDAWQMSPSLAFADLIAGLLALIGLPRFVDRLRQRLVDRLIWGGLAVAGVLALTALVHPSPRGAVLVVRLVVCVSLADLLVRTDGHRRDVLVRWLGIATLLQCGIAVAQRVTRHAVGLAFLGEPRYPFRAGYPVPAGTMRDAYPLAAFGLFAAALHAVAVAQGWRRGRLSPAVIVAGGVLAGLSGSRAAVLTAALIISALIISAGRKGIAAGALLVIGLALAGVPSHDLWLGRVAPVADTGGGVDASNGRSALTGQAIEIIRRNPLAGVGPGNYSRALSDIPALAERTSAYGVLPVHDMPLLAVAESGLLMVVPLGFVAGCLAIAGFRRRARWSPLLLAIVPYLLLDLVFWFYPEGLFMVAIAIGLTITGSLARSARPEPALAVGPAADEPSVDQTDRLAEAVAALALTAGRAVPEPEPSWPRSNAGRA